jgi:hypothetical protein
MHCGNIEKRAWVIPTLIDGTSNIQHRKFPTENIQILPLTEVS